MIYAQIDSSGELSLYDTPPIGDYIEINDDFSNQHLYYLENHQLRRAKEVNYFINVQDGIPYLFFDDEQVLIQISILGLEKEYSLTAIAGKNLPYPLGFSIDVNVNIEIKSARKDVYFEPIIIESEGKNDDILEPNIYIDMYNIIYVKHSKVHQEIEQIKEQINKIINRVV